MKICVTAMDKGIDSGIDPRFGRCAYFVIVDSESGSVNSFENTGLDAAGGAGIRAAEAVANLGAEVLLTGSVGPNAYSILSEVGIEVRVGIKDTVAAALDAYREGKLESIDSPNASAHAGMK